MSKAQRRRLEAFTLLELLIVVAILAIIGGALIVAYDGIQARAAKATSTHTVASLSQAIRSYASIERELPDELESLLSTDATDASYIAAKNDNVLTPTAAMAGSTLSGLLHEELRGDNGLGDKFKVQALDLDQKNALIAAGIDSIRYLDTKGDTGDGTLDISAADGTAATVGALADIDIPQLAFDVPRPGTGENRGRGFSYVLKGTPDAALPQVAVWDAGDGGYNNIKVGARANSVLIGLGVGNRASIVNANTAGEGDRTYLGSAPIYGNVKKNEYNHYIALIDVSVSPARFVAVVDAKGDFLDEEYAEAVGQKK